MLRAAFLDVGQGDTTVVWNLDTKQAIVVDCVNAVAIWDLLKQEQIKHVSAVIVTHLHADHYKQLTNFLDGCSTQGIEWDTVYLHPVTKRNFARLSDDDDGHSMEEVDTGDLNSKKRLDLYQNLISWSHRQSPRRIKASFEWLETIQIPGIQIEFLHPFDKDIGLLDDSGKLNNTSAVLKISDGGASILLTGDLEPDGWRLLISQHSKEVLASDVLKFPHHGAWKNSDVTAFLDQVTPQIIVISVGTNGYERYQHPYACVFEALKRYPNTQVFCTQMTSQCCSNVLEKRTQIRTLLDSTESSFTPFQGTKSASSSNYIVRITILCIIPSHLDMLLEVSRWPVRMKSPKPLRRSPLMCRCSRHCAKKSRKSTCVNACAR